jgi:hypothetical protein
MFGLVIYRFSPQIIWLAKKALGQTVPVDKVKDEAAERKLHSINMRAESKQLKYVGLNQIEALQSIVESRVMKEQRKSLVRTPQQIRESLLMKLNIPPSPLVNFRTSPAPVGPGGQRLLDPGVKRHSFIERKYPAPQSAPSQSSGKQALPLSSSASSITAPQTTSTSGLSGNSSTILNRLGSFSSKMSPPPSRAHGGVGSNQGKLLSSEDV